MKTRLVFILLALSMPTYAQFLPSPENLQGVWSGESTFGDLDNDGDLDLIVSGNNTVLTTASIFYRNDGNGNFAEAAILAGVDRGSIDLGDYDQDGLIDVLMVGSLENLNSTGTLLFKNKGNFVFEKVSHALPDINWGVGKFGDFDNDGDEDVLLVGGSLTDSYHDIYTNDQGTFTAQGLNLPSYNDPAISIGDYDRDSDLDYVVVGSGSTNAPSIFKNQGSYVFEPMVIYPNQIFDGDAAWGDFNNDGYPDLLVMGYDEVSATDRLIVLRNTGSGDFAPVAGPFEGLSDGNAAWGDLDNDGDRDVVVTGRKRNGVDEASTVIYLNNGGVFVKQTAGLPALTFSQVNLGDADNDLDLDIVVSGADPGSQLIDASTQLYLNSTAQVNTKPLAPGSLQFTQDGQRARLSWNKSSDGQTPADALTYTIYVNRVGGQNHSGQTLSDPSTGFRKVVRLGNVQHNTSWIIDNLEPGTYYWGVQAIDAGFTGSSFSVEQSFNMVGLPPAITGLSSMAEKTGVTVVIKGSNFIGTTSVKLKGAAAGFQVINSTTMKVVIPDVIGAGTFEITNATGTTTSAQSFCVIPATPTITGNTTVCPEAVSYEVEEIAGVTYEWTVDAGAEIVENNNHQIKVKWKSKGDYQLRVVPKTCQNGDGTSLTVQVNGPAWKEVVGDLTPTTESIGLYSINYTAGESYLWTLSQNGVPIESTASDFFFIKWKQPGPYNLQLTIANAECPAAPIEHNLAINVTLGAFSYHSQIPANANSALTFADLDNDGDQDFISNGNKLFENIMPAGFQELPASLPAASNIQYADVDGDNDLDLLITYYNAGYYEVAELENLGGLSFGAPVKVADKGASPVAAYIDFDNDGDLDIAWMGTSGIAIYERLTSGFQRVEGYSGIEPEILTGSIDIIDFNADGRSDIVTSSGGVFVNTGAKSFVSVDITYPAAITGKVKWVDLDQDGDLDLAHIQLDNIALYTNDGNTFTSFYSIAAPNSAAEFVDMNGDGWKDLVAGQGPVRVCFYDINTHSFSAPVQQFDAWGTLRNNDSWLSGVADLNSDKKNDLILYCTEFGNSSLVFYTNNHTNTVTPATIQSLTSTVTGNEVTLAWQGDVKRSFEVILGTSPAAIDKMATLSDLTSGYRKVLLPGNAGSNNFYKVTSLSPGTYYWRVQSVDHAFVGSPFSSPSSFTIGVPALPAPEILRINLVSNGITLLWKDNSNTEDGFIIERSDTDPESFVQAGSVAAGVTSFSENISVDAPRYYRVKAFNDNGESYYSNIFSTDDAIISAFPYFESFEGIAGRWHQLEGDEEQAINGLPLPGDWKKHGYVFGAADGTYALRIESAYHTAGTVAAIESPNFDLSGMINPCLVFDVSGELVDLASSGGGISVYATDDEELTWQYLSGFANEGGGWYRQQVDLNAYKSNIARLRIVGILSRATNQALSFDDIRVVECPTDPGNPLVTQAGPADLQLSWNHSLNATRYFLERQTDSDPYVYIDTLNAPVNTYLDRNLAQGKTYTYRMYAVNDVGPAYSNYVTLNAQYVTRAPVVQAIPNQTMQSLESLSVETLITDETPVTSLTITASSSNTNVLRSGDIAIEKKSGGIKITLVSAADVTGTTTITISVKDEYHTIESAFVLTVTGDNTIPQITSQRSAYAVNEDGLFTLSTNQLVIVDDDHELSDMTLTVASGTSYTVTGSVVHPAANFNGTLTIPVKVNDGSDDSNVFNFNLTVTPVNDIPQIIGLRSPLTLLEDTEITIDLDMLLIEDPDNAPGDLTINVLSGEHYTLLGNVLSPEGNFNGPLSIPVVVNDGQDNSEVFTITIDVQPVDDPLIIEGTNKTFVSTNGAPVVVELADLVVLDENHEFPAGYDLVIFAAENYSVEGNTI
ncbi:MAG TPA: FG-GAP-like repeat-containing protein, partial [Chryseolinea sp.]|nr:FG-GAP-like repeat-containing protein [Chryseolinea sp.]